jgi:phosphoglycerate dehydrogenase-like enzyme
MLNLLIDVSTHEPTLNRLRALPEVDVRIVESPADEARALPANLIADRDALFCSFPPTNLDDMRRLKFIQIASAGFTQLLGLELPRRGVRAANALGVFDVPIAEWNVAMMINLLRHQQEMFRNQQQGIWDRSNRFQGEIRGLTVGIWGYGGIGRETARLAKAMGMVVHVLTRSGVGPRINTYAQEGAGDPDGTLPDRQFTLDQKEAFLKGLDFLILAMPLSHANQGIVGQSELDALPSHAYILNPARGPLIQEQPLLRALTENRIAGAALDTHYHYPMPPEHPLWRMPNVIMTPHISGSSGNPRFTHRTWDLFLQNVNRFQSNQPLLNELTPAQLNDPPPLK